MKVPRPPGSGKAIARTKGVHREMESEGRSRQISGLTNRNHIRLVMGIRPPNRLKSHSYTEPGIVYVADTWRERVRSYPGRSHGRSLRHRILAVTVETRFVVRSQPRS